MFTEYYILIQLHIFTKHICNGQEGSAWPDVNNLRLVLVTDFTVPVKWD